MRGKDSSEGKEEQPLVAGIDEQTRNGICWNEQLLRLYTAAVTLAADVGEGKVAGGRSGRGWIGRTEEERQKDVA